ncbi:hypothetical protein DL96DRAFT_1622750 [Flagelloscypha sp. PMI_526]|nr:hypothetical protein DL96DRAFT_1622750 [Flagelloscypha sp. PMI_526]
MYPSVLLSVFLGVLSVSGVTEAIPIDERRSVAPLGGATLLQARSYGNVGGSILEARQVSNKKEKEKAAEAARLALIAEENRKANELKAQQEKERLEKAQKAKEAAEKKKKEEADAALKAQKEAAEKAAKAKADKRVTIQAGVTVPAGVQATCGGNRVHKTAKLKEAITDALVRKDELGTKITDADQPKKFGGVDPVPTGGRLRDQFTKCDTGKQLREWPIFSGDNLETRFNPSAKDDPSTDRVIFTEDGQYCGIVSHPPSVNKNDNSFVLCAQGN